MLLGCSGGVADVIWVHVFIAPQVYAIMLVCSEIIGGAGAHLSFVVVYDGRQEEIPVPVNCGIGCFTGTRLSQ